MTITLAASLFPNAMILGEAEELQKSDPAFKEGILNVELFKCYGPAALFAYLESSEKVWEKKP